MVFCTARKGYSTELVSRSAVFQSKNIEFVGGVWFEMEVRVPRGNDVNILHKIAQLLITVLFPRADPSLALTTPNSKADL